MSIVSQLEEEIANLNALLREKGLGQGEIDTLADLEGQLAAEQGLVAALRLEILTINEFRAGLVKRLAVANERIIVLEDELSAVSERAERFRTGAERLSAALGEIDALCMTPADRARDIATVGTPIPFYIVDCDEQGVVGRVRERLAVARNEALVEATKECHRMADCMEALKCQPVLPPEKSP